MGTKIVTWEKVFDGWSTAEAEAWRPVYSGFGWKTWSAWRTMMIQDLNLEVREWTQEEIAQPHDMISGYAIGGWNGWKKYRPAGKDIASFADITIPPKEGEQSYEGSERIDVRTNDKVIPLLGNINDTMLIGLQFSGHVAILEGTHRCAAIAIEAFDGEKKSSGKFTIQLAHFDNSEADLLRVFCIDRPRSKKV